jgi:hypothetical protein
VGEAKRGSFSFGGVGVCFPFSALCVDKREKERERKKREREPN